MPFSWRARDEPAGVFRVDDFSQSTLEDVRNLVGSYKRSTDIAVASVHWGGNWGYEIPQSHVRFAHGLVEEAGIDLVHGHSSHHVKAFDIHRGKLILYGCGDLLTDYEGISGHEEYRGEVGLMYFPRLDSESGQLTGLEMVPTRVRRFQLTRASSADVRWLVDVLNRVGARFDVEVEQTDSGRLAVVGL